MNFVKESKARSAIVLCAALVVVLIALLNFSRSVGQQEDTSATPLGFATVASGVTNAEVAPAANQVEVNNLEVQVKEVVAQVRPAVVFIGIKGQLPNNGPLELIGNGSGAIIDTEGHILTNNHVVENAEALVVTLPDGRSFDATVVGRDPATDLAVIRIQGDNLPTVPLGNSDELELGEFVVAIGNALGLEGGPTVTVGVVSATERTITEENGASISGLIQTDAAINPGNSGGPLVNLDGEMIGINTATAGSTGRGYQPSGISFAIAVNEAIPIQEQLLTQGRVIRPYLGVAPVTVTPALRAQFGIDVEEGVILANVNSNSPAAEAGLQQGDIVVQADGQALQNAAQLREIIGTHEVGDSLNLEVIREGTRRSVTATLVESPPLP